MEITKSPTLQIPPEAVTGTVHLPLQVPLQLAGKLYQDSRDYQSNFGEDQPKSSYFYIIDKVLKFLLAAGGLSVPLPRARGQREQWWEIQFIQDSDRQHWCSSQGQECLLILRRKKKRA